MKDNTEFHYKQAGCMEYIFVTSYPKDVMIRHEGG